MATGYNLIDVPLTSLEKIMGAIVDKPWGQYTDFFRSHNVVFKQIFVKPQEELSYQSHEKRSEFWYVQSGTGELTLEGLTTVMERGDNVKIDKRVKHKIKNIGQSDLIIYEMQCGECDEEDIIRYEDKYGRENAPPSFNDVKFY